MTTGRINQIAFVEKRSRPRETTRGPPGKTGAAAAVVPRLRALRQSFRFSVRLPFRPRSSGLLEPGRGRRRWRRTGARRSLPPFHRVRGVPSRSPSCVRCLRPRCEGRRSGPSRRLTVRLDTSDKGLGTALPFPGVARMPEARTSRPGGRSVAI